jgi:hypothetical protein
MYSCETIPKSWNRRYCSEINGDRRTHSRSINCVSHSSEEQSSVYKKRRLEGEKQEALCTRSSMKRSTGGCLFPIRVFET